MKKIMNYIYFGKGYGLIFLLAAAIVSTVMVIMPLKDAYQAEILPKIREVAEQILPINVENGQIVSPLNVYKKVELKLDDEKSSFSFPIVLDTREETKGVPNETLGFYIYKDMLYFINKSKIERANLTDGLLDMGRFDDLSQKLFDYGCLAFAIIYIISLFLNKLFYTLVVAFGYSWFEKAMKKTELTNFKVIMRAVSLLCAIIAVIQSILYFMFGISFGAIVYLVILFFAVVQIFQKNPKEV